MCTLVKYRVLVLGGSGGIGTFAIQVYAVYADLAIYML